MKTILFSGGLDSTILAYDICHNNTGKEKVLLLSFDYGAKNNKKELEFAKNTFHKLKKKYSDFEIEHTVLPFNFSDLGINCCMLKNSELDIKNGCIKSTLVPYRNGVLISIAVALTQKGTVFLGSHLISTPHPDNSPEFIMYINSAALIGTNYNVSVKAPYAHLTKRELIENVGLPLCVPINDTWTCHKEGEIHCGVCGVCVDRKEQLLGFDTTIYKE